MSGLSMRQESQNSAESSSSILRWHLRTISRMGIKKALAENIPRFTNAKPEELAKTLRYVSGKQRGKRVAARTLRYAMQPENEYMPSTGLLEALAHKFKCLPAELIIDWDADRKTLLERVMTSNKEPIQRPVTHSKSITPAKLDEF